MTSRSSSEEDYIGLSEISAPFPVQNVEGRGRSPHTRSEHSGIENRSIHRERSRPQKDDEYDFPIDVDNVDEVAASPPVQDVEEGPWRRHSYLEDVRSRSTHRDRFQSPLSEWRLPPPRNVPSGEDIGDATMSGAVSPEETPSSPHRASRILTEIYTNSYLIFFSFAGTIARLVLEGLTFYPGAPVITSVLWANFAGSFIMGFLSEDYQLFRSDSGEKAMSPKSGSADAWKVTETKRKKTVPLYIGLTTGFCGCLTSFSSFIRDAFLALANDLPSTTTHGPEIHLYQLPPPEAKAPNGGYSFMAVIAVFVLEIGLSLVALFLGAHFAIFTAKWMPTVSPGIIKTFVDPFVVIMAPTVWILTICLAVWLPQTEGDHIFWSRELWRGPALYAIIFSPVGCLARFHLSTRFNGRIPAFPLGTFLSNVGGTMILGMAFALQHAPLPASSPLGGGSYPACEVLQGIIDGFCGCITTVSTWVLELSDLRRKHAYSYGLASVAIALAALVIEIGSLKWTRGLAVPVCFA